MRLVFLMMAIVLGGCVTIQMYDGPRLPENRVVRITGSSNLEGKGFTAVVCKIDNRTLKPCRSDIEIKPGKHTLKIVATGSGDESNSAWVSKVFHAGERYILVAEDSASAGSHPRILFRENINE